MDAHGIYFAAVVWPKDRDQPPYVSTPLGPYHPDELAAHQRAKAWLADVYKTDDIRLCDPKIKVDVEWARTMIMNDAHKEYRDAMQRRERTVQITILANTDAACMALEDVMTALGVHDEDV